MEKLKVRAVIKYLYLKGMTPQEIFYHMKETLAESTLAYATAGKWHSELT